MRTYVSYILIALVSGGLVWGVTSWLNSPARRSVKTDTQLANDGPVIPGICVLGRQAVIDVSQVGKVANTRYGQMRDGIRSKIEAEQARIVGDAKLLQGQKSSLPAADFQKRDQDIAARLQQLRNEAAEANRDLEATRQSVVTRISSDLLPVINSEYRRQHCGLLVVREAPSVAHGRPGTSVPELRMQDGIGSR